MLLCYGLLACHAQAVHKAQHVIRESKKTKESRVTWMKELKAGTTRPNCNLCLNFGGAFKF